MPEEKREEQAGAWVGWITDGDTSLGDAEKTREDDDE